MPRRRKLPRVRRAARATIPDMYDIRFAEPDDLSATLALLVRLQADTAHHIGYLGETVGELSEELAEFEPDWADVHGRRHRRLGRVCGVLSVEVDAELGRAWLHGPFVDVPVNHPAGSRIWDQTADGLYAAAGRLPQLRHDHRPRAVRAHQPPQARRVRRAARVLGRSRQRRLRARRCRAAHPAVPGRELPAYRPRPRDACAANGSGRARGCRRAARAMLPEELPVRAAARGPHAGTTRSSSRWTVTGYSATPRARRNPRSTTSTSSRSNQTCAGSGVGAALVTELVWTLAAGGGPRPHAAAAVLTGNEPSERMFARLGFHLHVELVAYRANDTA